MNKKISIFDCINNFLLIFVAVVCVYPFAYILFMSISDGNAISSGAFRFWPVDASIEAYKFILTSKTIPIFTGMSNSFIYTILGTISSILFTYMTAYVLSRRQIKGRYMIMSIFIFTWVFEAGIIPAYIILSKMGYVNNPLIMIIPGAINVQYLIITKAFLDALPYELEEAAHIDGANDFQIMMQIYIPVSKTIIATVGVFYAIYIWNQYLVPQIYLQDKDLHTIQLILKNMVISTAGDANTSFRTFEQNGMMLNPQNLKAAAIFTAMLPIVCVYPFVQKYFKKGILIGSVKG